MELIMDPTPLAALSPSQCQAAAPPATSGTDGGHFKL